MAIIRRFDSRPRDTAIRAFAAGAGPPLSDELRERLTEQRRSRAREELLDVRLDPKAPYLLADVANPIRGSRYRVHLPTGRSFEGALCECTDFSTRGLGTCKHLEAVRLWLVDHPEVGPPTAPGRWPEAAAWWRELDARLAAGPRSRQPLARWWRSAGALLYAAPSAATARRPTPMEH